MECEKCKYLYEEYVWGPVKACSITHYTNPKSCSIESDEDVKKMKICYNCKHWIGGGDWGLSCKKNYYLCSSNGFNVACDQFDRRMFVK